MPRRISPSDLQRAVNDYNRRLRAAADAINKHNANVAKHNQEVVRRHNAKVQAVNNHNRQINAQNQEVVRRRTQAINNYNRTVRDHNAQLRANEQRRVDALRRLYARPETAFLTGMRESALVLDDAYTRLQRRVMEEDGETQAGALAHPSEENANSLEVISALLQESNPDALSDDDDDLEDTAITTELADLSLDLDGRWRGALFALNPRNPDAARHFCTSAREVLTQILDQRAPDSDVIAAAPHCELTRDNRPTRRSKIRFILERRALPIEELGDFVEADIANIVELFGVFNSATHGTAGKYPLHQLRAIKNRVEGGILFLANLTRH